MHTKRSSMFLAAVLGLTFAGGGLLQNAEAQQGAGDEWAALFDLTFVGGTVTEYVAAIRDANPGADIVISDDRVGDVRLSDIRLTAVDVHAAMELISLAPVEGGTDIVVRRIEHANGVDAIYSVFAGNRGIGQYNTRVWSIARPLALHLSAESVLSAVEAALEISGAEATIRFHPDTALLIVKAPNHGLDVVEQALDEMTNSARELQGQRVRDDEEIDSLQYQLAEAEGQARIASEQMRLAAQEFEWMSDAPVSDDPRDDIRQRAMIEMEMIRAETRLDLARRMEDLLRSQIKRLQGDSGE